MGSILLGRLSFWSIAPRPHGPEPELIYITSTKRRAASSANFQRDHHCPETAHFFINQSYWTFPCGRMNHLFGDGLRTHNGTNMSQTNRRVYLSVKWWYSFSTCSFLRSAPATLYLPNCI
uniref:(northern house mosquito) hypothetical protein n=1 Tax=Culex pipiens TaxID=7175 RepID=A0A8D8FJJ3_CULPI